MKGYKGKRDINTHTDTYMCVYRNVRKQWVFYVEKKIKYRRKSLCTSV